MFIKSIRIILNKSCHRFLLDFYLKKLINTDLKDDNKNIVVDFGCGNPRYKDYLPLSKWNFFDKKSSIENVEYADEEHIPVEKADLFLCIEVLQYLNMEQIRKLSLEINRIISIKGKAILTVPYLYPCNHKEYIRLRKPEDYFKENKNLKITHKGFGNLFSIIHDTIYQFVIYRKTFFLKNIMLLILLPLKYISLILEKKEILKIDSGFILCVTSNEKNKKTS